MIDPDAFSPNSNTRAVRLWGQSPEHGGFAPGLRAANSNTAANIKSPRNVPCAMVRNLFALRHYRGFGSGLFIIICRGNHVLLVARQIGRVLRTFPARLAHFNSKARKYVLQDQTYVPHTSVLSSVSGFVKTEPTGDKNRNGKIIFRGLENVL